MVDMTTERFLELETRVWEALCAGDAAADAALLSGDFLGVYPTGFAGRAEHTGELADGPTVAEYALHDARTLVVTDDDVLLAYRAEYRRAAGAAPETMYVSSLWSRRDGTWRNTFSQDTPAGPAVV
jgi:hypothetical protein